MGVLENAGVQIDSLMAYNAANAPFKKNAIQNQLIKSDEAGSCLTPRLTDKLIPILSLNALFHHPGRFMSDTYTRQVVHFMTLGPNSLETDILLDPSSHPSFIHSLL